MRLILLTMALAALGAAQTQPRASQVKQPTVAAASVMIVLPTGAVVYAKLDAAFTLDTTTSPPTLRVATTGPAPAAALPVVYKLTRNTDLSYALPPAGRLTQVYRNGLLQTLTTDYTITSNILRFTPANCCEADEAITAVVWP